MLTTQAVHKLARVVLNPLAAVVGADLLVTVAVQLAFLPLTLHPIAVVQGALAFAVSLALPLRDVGGRGSRSGVGGRRCVVCGAVCGVRCAVCVVGGSRCVGKQRLHRTPPLTLALAYRLPLSFVHHAICIL